jgi:hypothetical protein
VWLSWSLACHVDEQYYLTYKHLILVYCLMVVLTIKTSDQLDIDIIFLIRFVQHWIRKTFPGFTILDVFKCFIVFSFSFNGIMFRIYFIYFSSQLNLNNIEHYKTFKNVQNCKPGERFANSMLYKTNQNQKETNPINKWMTKDIQEEVKIKC